MMNRLMWLIPVALLSSCGTLNIAHACSWVTTISESESRRVLVGRIQGTVTELYEGREIFGVTVSPIIEYGTEVSARDEDYVVFPHGVGADCSDRYFTPSPRLSAHFVADQLVTLVGYVTIDARPGNLSLSFGSGLDFLPEHCTQKELELDNSDFSSKAPRCGSEIFHTYKDLAMLPNAESEEVLGILSRLSNSSYWVSFEEIVDKYVSSDVDRVILMRLRYGPAMDIGCAVEPKVSIEYGDEYQARRIARSRWYEYCTRAKIDAAKAGT